MGKYKKYIGKYKTNGSPRKWGCGGRSPPPAARTKFGSVAALLLSLAMVVANAYELKKTCYG